MSLVRQNEVSREPPHLGDGTLANLVPAVKDFIESTQVLPSSTGAHKQLFLDICRLTWCLGSGESLPTAQILYRRKGRSSEVVSSAERSFTEQRQCRAVAKNIGQISEVMGSGFVWSIKI